MYNKGKLTGFGWANVGKYEYTQRTEYPPLSALSVSLMKYFFQLNIMFFFKFLVIFGTCSSMYASTI